MPKELNPFEILGIALRERAHRPNIRSYQPHSKQEEFHKSTAYIRQFIGGNRSGKTVAGVCEDIWRAEGKHPFQEVHPPPVTIRICTVDFNVGLQQLLLPVLTRFLPPSLLRNGSFSDSWNSDPPELYLSNGSVFEFKSYEQALVKFAGTSRPFIHFDEEPPEDVYKECLMRTIDCSGKLIFTMTPVEGMTWTYDQIYRKGMPEDGSPGDPNIFIIEVAMEDNPYLGEVEMQMALSNLDKNELSARKSGKYVMIGGLMYPNFNPKIHVIPEGQFELPANWNVYTSMDHGLANPTSWHWHTVDPIGRIITFDEHYEPNQVIQHHAAAYHRTNEKWGRLPEYNVGDPSIKNRDKITNTSVQQEYIKNGIFIILGNNDKAAGINRVRSYLNNGPDGSPMWLITSNCEKLIWEFKRYRRKNYKNKKLAADHNYPEEPIDRDNHALDDGRYFIMSRPDIKILGPTYPEIHRIGNIFNLPSVVPATGRIVNSKQEWSTEAINNRPWWTEEYLGGDW